MMTYREMAIDAGASNEEEIQQMAAMIEADHRRQMEEAEFQRMLEEAALEQEQDDGSSKCE
jgi:hypothetical protein